MKQACSFLLVLVLGSFLPAEAQLKQFLYQRELPPASAQWNRIILPEAVFGKLNADRSDLRIIGITPGNDTITAPYILQDEGPKQTTDLTAARLINQSFTRDGSFVTVAMANNQPINRLLLDCGRRNFDWRIRLEGSQDQQAWFTLLNNYRVLGIENELTRYQFTTLVFAPSSYRYYRIFIAAQQHTSIRGIQTGLYTTKDGSIKKYSIHSTRVEEDTKSRQTIVQVTLPSSLPLSRLKVQIHDTIDYYRPVQLLYVADSFKTAVGWQYRFEPAAKATLSAVEQNELQVDRIIAGRWQLLIDNGDNQPLKIDSIEMMGFEESLVTRLTEPARYFLVYGNRQAGKPVYDIEQFVSKIPSVLPVLQPGAEMDIITAQAPLREPLFKNKWWLWVIMVVIMIVLGWFSLSMMKKAGNK
jgi:Protein of unknown function (DUF3999)